jgi:hypothetical protein
MRPQDAEESGELAENQRAVALSDQLGQPLDQEVNLRRRDVNLGQRSRNQNRIAISQHAA